MVENTANQHTPDYLQILKSVRKCRVLVPPFDGLARVWVFATRRKERSGTTIEIINFTSRLSGTLNTCLGKLFFMAVDTYRQRGTRGTL